MSLNGRCNATDPHIGYVHQIFHKFVPPPPLTTSRERADKLGTEVYSRAIEICWRLDELCKVRSGSAEDFKWSDSTARIAYQTLQRLMIKIRDGRLHSSVSHDHQ